MESPRTVIIYFEKWPDELLYFFSKTVTNFVSSKQQNISSLQYNGNSENWQHDKLLFLRFDYSLVIIRNEILQNIYCTDSEEAWYTSFG